MRARARIELSAALSGCLVAATLSAQEAVSSTSTGGMRVAASFFLRGGESAVSCSSSDGRWHVSLGHEACELIVFDSLRGVKAAEHDLWQSTPTDLEFSPDESRLVVYGHEVVLYAVGAWRELGRYRPTPRHSVSKLRWSADGAEIACRLTEDLSVTLRASDLRERMRFETDSRAQPRWIDWDEPQRRGGRKVVATTKGRGVQEAQALSRERAHRRAVRRAVATADGRCVVLQNLRSVACYDAETGVEIELPGHFCAGRVVAVRGGRDRSLIACVHRDRCEVYHFGRRRLTLLSTVTLSPPLEAPGFLAVGHPPLLDYERSVLEVDGVCYRVMGAVARPTGAVAVGVRNRLSLQRSERLYVLERIPNCFGSGIGSIHSLPLDGGTPGRVERRLESLPRDFDVDRLGERVAVATLDSLQLLRARDFAVERRFDGGHDAVCWLDGARLLVSKRNDWRAMSHQAGWVAIRSASDGEWMGRVELAEPVQRLAVIAGGERALVTCFNSVSLVELPKGED